MQTFLVSPSFTESARILDNRRLGKQRLETMQIMKALAGETRGWVNHPATRMWRGYELALLEYQRAMVYEWVHNRGFYDTCLAKTEEVYFYHAPLIGEWVTYPPWLGDYDFHLAHQSNLVRKDPIYYGEFFPNVPDNLPYIWPEGEYV